MTFAGLVSDKNLSDVSSVEQTWDNLGASFSYKIGSVTTSGATVVGADILALNGIGRLSTRDLLLLNGLTSDAQPRLNTIAAQIASGIFLQNNALLRASPTSSGDYSIDGNLSFQTLNINGLQVQSLSTAPFSGNTATTEIKLQKIYVDSGLVMQDPIVSGTVNSPELAIPIETDELLFAYIKAGQS